jgi:hypothetical protein
VPRRAKQAFFAKQREGARTPKRCLENHDSNQVEVIEVPGSNHKAVKDDVFYTPGSVMQDHFILE